MTDAEMEKLMQAVAERTAAIVASRVPTTAEMEAISKRAAEETVENLLKRLGIPEDNLDDWHADRLWTRNTRMIQSAVIKQGIGFVILAALGAIGTALVFWIRSGAPRP